MNETTRRRLIESLTAISTLAPEMRFGQLMATLGFLAEDMSQHTIWDIEDTDLLSVLQRHLAELASRQPSVAESRAAQGR